MLCPTCERRCGEDDEVCLRCRTVLRERMVMHDASTSAAGGSTGRSYGWIWGVLAVLLVSSGFRACSKTARENAEQGRAAPPSPEDSREAFLTSFTTACLKKKGNSLKFCNCAAPKVLDNFKEDEIDGVIESTRNGRPDIRMSTIIVQCSR